jgi:hypothetical protein
LRTHGEPWAENTRATNRFSCDLDLLRMRQLDAGAALEELRTLARPRPGEHLTFVVGDSVYFSSANPVLQVSVTVNESGRVDIAGPPPPTARS